MNYFLSFRKKYISLVASILRFLENIFFYPVLSNKLKSLTTKDDLVIFDVGANRGQSIVYYKKLFKHSKLFSFEPSPQDFSHLNSVASKYDSVQVFNLGLGNSTTELTFYLSDLSETSTFILPDSDSNWNKLKSKILWTSTDQMYSPVIAKITTLDEFVSGVGVSVIDILKIDVEGFEYDVLLGASNLLSHQRVNLIQLERHEDDLRPSDRFKISEFLLLKKYHLRYSVRHSFGRYYEDIWTL
jgi:FkbM family methyltransferase